MEFYIRDKAQPEGPYDIMSLIRKIRNGALTENTLVSKGVDGELKAAVQWSELAQFFNEADTDDVVISRQISPKQRRTFGDMLLINIDFLRSNTLIAVYSGVFMLIWLVVSLLFLSDQSFIKSFLGVTLSYFILGSYLFGLLKYIESRTFDTWKIVNQTVLSAKRMGQASLIVAGLMSPVLLVVHYLVPDEYAFISLPILFIVLFVILTLFAFVPLLIMQKQRGCRAAIMDSIRYVKQNGGENLGMVFALITLNFIFLPFLPVILPITCAALVELYEERFG